MARKLLLAKPLGRDGSADVSWRHMRFTRSSAPIHTPQSGARRRKSMGMRQRTSQTLYAYWNDVRGSRLAPRRFEIEPGRIAEILPESFILECSEGQGFSFRLAGTRICDQFGREFRGTSFLELTDEANRGDLRRYLTTMAEHGAVGLFQLEAAASRDRYVDFEILALPLVHTQETITRFLGSISAIDPPEWLGSEPLRPLRFRSLELIWPDGRPHAILERARRQAPFLPHVQDARIVRSERRQFRVFDGGKASSTDNRD
jgi:hypothetical protein